MQILLAATALIALVSPAFADVTVGLGVSITGNADIKVAKYDCEGHDPFTVQYINAAPNFLALIPIDGQMLVFVSTLTGSGVKYESGQYVWWNKGTDATLSDVTEGLDAAPVLTCTEEVDTP